MVSKSISKSVRLTDEVYGYIMEAPGKGFNEKFENIILEAKKEEPLRKKHLASLSISIEAKQREIKELYDRYSYLDEFFRGVLRMQHQLFDLGLLLDKAVPKGPEEAATGTTNQADQD